MDCTHCGHDETHHYLAEPYNCMLNGCSCTRLRIPATPPAATTAREIKQTAEPSPFHAENARKIANRLGSAFVWADTKEGAGYWSDLRRRLDEIASNLAKGIRPT